MLRRHFAGLLPSALLFVSTSAWAQEPAEPAAPPAKLGTIVETAVAAGSFETLVAAVKAAGLVETLSGEGPFTVFAPTDEAFSALPKGTIASLLKPENKDKLIQILTYHVVAGKVESKDALGLKSAATVAGPSITITLTESGANINGARLLQTDIETSNGVIHVIDRVLLPSDAPETKATAAKPAADPRAVAKATLYGALKEGVPMFNSGHHGRCAEIYMQAVQTVTAMSDLPMTDSLRHQCNQTVSSCQRMVSTTDRAWALRHQIDRMLMEL